MEILSNLFFWTTLLLGIALVGTFGYAKLLRSMKRRKQLERARLVKDIRNEVRRYLEELKS